VAVGVLVGGGRLSVGGGVRVGTCTTSVGALVCVGAKVGVTCTSGTPSVHEAKIALSRNPPNRFHLRKKRVCMGACARLPSSSIFYL